MNRNSLLQEDNVNSHDTRSKDNVVQRSNNRIELAVVSSLTVVEFESHRSYMKHSKTATSSKEMMQ
jgi:hypothetical protein